MVDLPFKETPLGGSIYERTFKSDLSDEDLKWHWDEEDRTIKTLHETDWQFQFDNNLPIKIEGEIRIPKGVWHRLIKGTGDLKLSVLKHNSDI
jgi:hypothetical protein